jgi:hypothetical protein
MATGITSLETFVYDALRSGQSRAEITRVLIQAGWPAPQVTLAVDAYADVDFAIPVPRPRVSLSAREMFLYLVLFTALYVALFHLGDILFDLIDRAFPDPIARSYGVNLAESMRWSLSAVIVAFPVFLWTSYYVSREIAENPAGRLSPVRRWCTYLTLFLAVACLIGDGTALVFNVLGGELSTRFLLKVVVVGVIAGSALGYYLRDLRAGERSP